jgi:hypothetical protein
VSDMTDERFLALLAHGEGTLIEKYFLYRDLVAGAEIVGCWDADFGVWGFTPVDLNPHGPEYSELREFLRRRGCSVFASTDEVYEHARRVGWPNADGWESA